MSRGPIHGTTSFVKDNPDCACHPCENKRARISAQSKLMTKTRVQKSKAIQAYRAKKRREHIALYPTQRIGVGE